MKTFFYLISAFLVISLSGCKSLDLEGVYSGLIDYKDASGTHKQSLVKLEIKSLSSGSFDAKLSSTDPLPISSQFQISDAYEGSHTISLNQKDLKQTNISLNQEQESGCWRSEDIDILLCASADRFDLQVLDKTLPNFHITTKKGVPDSATNTPNQSSFFVEDLQNISRTHSFDTRMEYERVIQARKTAQATWLALTPRLTLNSISNVMGEIVGLSGMLNVVSDLAPFLFPTNWLNAKESSLQAKIEKQTQTILKLDTVLQVESLSDLILRDIDILAAYSELIAYVQLIKNEVQIRESLGQYPAGSTDNIQSLLNSMTLDSSVLAEGIQQQKQNLTTMVGFNDVNTVKSLVWKNEPFPIENPLLKSPDEILQETLKLSLELQQISTIIELAQTDNTKTYWSWMDPSGAALTGIGLPYGAMIEVSQSKVREMQVQKELVYANIVKKVQQSASTLKLTLNEHKLSSENLKLQEKRRFLFENKIKLGFQIDFFGLLSVLQDNLTARIRLASSVADYRIARAGILRLTLSNSYETNKEGEP